MNTKAWPVPNWVTLTDSSGVSRVVSLNQVEALTLGRMCDEFRTEVFRKAGVKDPATTYDHKG